MFMTSYVADGMRLLLAPMSISANRPVYGEALIQAELKGHAWRIALSPLKP